MKDPAGRYQGVKTGHTPNAGSCLCSLYIDIKKGYKFLICLIGCNSNKHRFQETCKLINWCISHLYMKNSKPFLEKSKFKNIHIANKEAPKNDKDKVE